MTVSGQKNPRPAQPADTAGAPWTAHVLLCGRLAPMLPVAVEKWLWLNLVIGSVGEQARLRSRSGFARPYICLLIILMRLTWPSTAPEL
jgi:hypothetical protein